MARDNKKNNEVVRPDLIMTGGVDKSSDSAYNVRDKSRIISTKVSVTEAKRGIVLAEVLGLPLSKRGRGRRWS